MKAYSRQPSQRTLQTIQVVCYLSFLVPLPVECPHPHPEALGPSQVRGFHHPQEQGRRDHTQDSGNIPGAVLVRWNREDFKLQ